MSLALLRVFADHPDGDPTAEIEDLVARKLIVFHATTGSLRVFQVTDAGRAVLAKLAEVAARSGMTFWDQVAMRVAVTIVRNTSDPATGLTPMHPAMIAKVAAELADALHEERARRLTGGKPS